MSVPFNLKASRIELLCTTISKMNGQHTVYVIINNGRRKDMEIFSLYSSVGLKDLMGFKKEIQNERREKLTNYSFSGKGNSFEIYISMNKTLKRNHLLKKRKYGLVPVEISCKNTEDFNKVGIF